MTKLQCLIQIFILLFIIFVNLQSVSCYSKISFSGYNNTNYDVPKIFKATNLDLLFSQKDETTTPAATISTQTPSVQASTSSWRSFQQPSIYITPIGKDYPPKTTPTTIEVASLTTKPHLVAKTYALTNETLEKQFEGDKEAGEEVVLPTQSQPLKEQKQQTIFTSTGRAANFHTRYPFGQLITSLPQNVKPSITKGYHHQRYHHGRPSLLGKHVYPVGSYGQRYQSQQRTSSKDKTIDRFSPSEAVVSHQLKNEHLHYNPSFGGALKASAVASSDQTSSFVPPKELYSFPPNIDAKYPSPSQDPQAILPSSSITSYLRPPSGPLTNADAHQTLPPSDENVSMNAGGYVYSGPINPSYVPPAGTEEDEDSKKPNANGNSHDNDENNIGVLPASAMNTANSDTAHTSDMDSNNDEDANAHETDHSHDHHSLIGFDADKEYPTPPPGWLEEHPEDVVDVKPLRYHRPSQPLLAKLNHDARLYHHYDNHHHSELPSFPVYPYKKPYPESIYDDSHHHHHHHDHPHIHQPEPEVNITTLPPPPEPRVKKYSYFYIGRKLWYIPLYFTVWFSFYVLWLIIKSIARHKVNLPNHYVSRRSLPRSLSTQNSSKEYIDELTISVLKSIDRFQEMYLS